MTIYISQRFRFVSLVNIRFCTLNHTLEEETNWVFSLCIKIPTCPWQTSSLDCSLNKIGCTIGDVLQVPYLLLPKEVYLGISSSSIPLYHVQSRNKIYSCYKLFWKYLQILQEKSLALESFSLNKSTGSNRLLQFFFF